MYHYVSVRDMIIIIIISIITIVVIIIVISTGFQPSDKQASSQVSSLA